MEKLLQRYLSFQGKCSRQQYWLRTLVFLVGSFLLVFLLKSFPSDSNVLWGMVWFLVWLYVISTTGARRCQDAGINPHWVFLWLLPPFGNIFYIALGCLEPDDGTRIIRPLPKKGLVRYLSIDGYATRQEYWCITMPVTFAFISVLAMFAYLISLLFSPLLSNSASKILDYILSFSVWGVGGVTASWLTTAVTLRRCRDAALNLKWALGLLIPLWLTQIATLPFVALPLKQQMFTAQASFLQSIQNLGLHNAAPLLAGIVSLLLVFFTVACIIFGCLKSKEKPCQQPPTR